MNAPHSPTAPKTIVTIEARPADVRRLGRIVAKLKEERDDPYIYDTEVAGAAKLHQRLAAALAAKVEGGRA